MEIDFSNVNINSEEDLIEFVNNLNIGIELANITRSKEEQQHTLNLNYLLEKYRKIKSKEGAKDFRVQHDCKCCLYYERPRSCFETEKCPLDKDKKFKLILNPKKCIRDKDGNCPYGRVIETCIGYCMKDIVEEHRKHWLLRYEEMAVRKKQ